MHPCGLYAFADMESDARVHCYDRLGGLFTLVCKLGVVDEHGFFKSRVFLCDFRDVSHDTLFEQALAESCVVLYAALSVLEEHGESSSFVEDLVGAACVLGDMLSSLNRDSYDNCSFLESVCRIDVFTTADMAAHLIRVMHLLCKSEFVLGHCLLYMI